MFQYLLRVYDKPIPHFVICSFIKPNKFMSSQILRDSSGRTIAEIRQQASQLVIFDASGRTAWLVSRRQRQRHNLRCRWQYRWHGQLINPAHQIIYSSLNPFYVRALVAIHFLPHHQKHPSFHQPALVVFCGGFAAGLDVQHCSGFIFHCLVCLPQTKGRTRSFQQ